MKSKACLVIFVQAKCPGVFEGVDIIYIYNVVAKNVSIEINGVAKDVSYELGLVYVYSVLDVFNTDLINNFSSLSVWHSFRPGYCEFCVWEIDHKFQYLIHQPFL